MINETVIPFQQIAEEIHNVLTDENTSLSIGAERALNWILTWVSVPPPLRDLSDEEIIDVYHDGPLYHTAMIEDPSQDNRDEARRDLLNFARDILAKAREKV